MKNPYTASNRTATFVMTAAICFFVIAGSARTAQSGGPYRIAWSTIDAGGKTTAGGTYTLTGTVGQPDAGYHGGGHYALLGGFWPGGPLCFVNLEDFANFASFWLDSFCDESNLWCDGADLDASGAVTIDDFAMFLDAWLNVCPYAWPLK